MQHSLWRHPHVLFHMPTASLQESSADICHACVANYRSSWRANDAATLHLVCLTCALQHSMTHTDRCICALQEKFIADMRGDIEAFLQDSSCSPALTGPDVCAL
jgi:hypothetical protein